MATNFPNKQWIWKHNIASTARVYFVSTTVSFTMSPSSRYGSAAADPQTLAVLCKAFATLKYQAPLELEKGEDLNEVDR